MPNGTKVVEMKTRVGVAGEQTYREALKNISRELRVQKVEMDAVTSAYGANQNSIEALTAKQEALTKQQDAHREKVQILSEMLEIAKQEFGENSEEADQYRIKLATAQTALNKCSNEINTTSTALAEAQKATQENADATDALGDTVGEAGDALDEYGEAAGETGDSLDELGDSADDASGKNQAFLSVMAGAAKTLGNVVVAGAKLAAKALLEVGKAAANATKEGFELSKEAGKYADDIATLSTQTGVSQSSLQQWTYASNFVDTSVDSITSSMTKLTQTMGNALNGSSEASDKFATLGVSITDVHGRLRSTEDVFWDAIDALGKIENPAERDAAAIALFGESAQKLNPLIAAGREGFEALNAEAERLGTVFSDEEIATMGGFDDAMQRNSQAVTGLKNAIGLALIPAFQPLVNRATEAMGRVNHAIRDGLTPDEMGELMDYLLDEMDGAIEYIISIIEDALPMLPTAVGKLVSSLGSKLPGMVNRLLPALASAAVQLVSGLFSGLLAAIEPCWEAVKDGVGEAMGKVWTGITSAFGTLGGILENVLNLPEGTITDPLNEAIGAVGGYFASVWNAITSAFGTLGGILKDLLTGKIDLGEALETAKSTVKEKFKQVWDAICSAFGTFTNILGNIFGVTDLDTKASNMWKAIKGGVTKAFSNAWNDILGSFGNLADWFGHIWDGVAEAIEDAWGNMKGGIETAITGAWDWITGLFGGGEEETHGSGVHTSSSGAGRGGDGREFPETTQGSTVVQDVVSDQVLSQLAGSISGEEDGVREAMQTVLQAAIDATNELMTVDAGKPLGKDWVTGVADGISEDGHKVQDEMGTVFGDMLSALQAVVDSGTFNSIGAAISSGIAVGIRSGTGAVVQAARSAARQAYYAARTELNINSPSKKTREIGESYTEGFALGIERTTPRIVEAAQTLSDIALRTTQTTRSSVPIDYNQIADAAVYAARQSTAPAAIDYDRMGDATAAAMRREGLGQTTMVMDRQIVARTIEPSVSRSSADRGNHTIAGRTAKLVIV